jgi:hypothetical protein
MLDNCVSLSFKVDEVVEQGIVVDVSGKAGNPDKR